MKPRQLAPWVLAAAAAALTGCGGGGTSVTDTAGTTPGATFTPGNWTWELPSGFAVPKVPEGNPMSAAKVDLGRFLFYDKRLWGNGTQSCASCHHQDKAFTDGKPVAIGSTGDMHPRAAQPLMNVAYNATLTWANPSLVTLEKQMEVPLFGDNPVEMGVNDGNKDKVLGRIQGDARYTEMFAKAFPGVAAPITWGNITRAVSSFQRTLLSGNSKFDRAQQGIETLSPAERRGQTLFFGEKAECFHCHAGFNFNDQVVHASTLVLDTPFHSTGLYNLGNTGNFPPDNQGLFEFTNKPSDRGLFRAPSLRNVEVTGPYMHDGSVATLEAVLDFYAAGGRNITAGPYAGDGRLHPNKSDLISRIDLNDQERADLVAFLKTLTDHEFLTNPKFSDPFAAER